MRLTLPLPAVATTPDGAGGGPTGVMEAEAAELGPVPSALVAVTVNVYGVPLARPVTDTEVAGGEPLTTVVGCAIEPT